MRNKKIIIENKIGLKITFYTLGASLYNVELKNEKGKYESMSFVPKNFIDFAKEDMYFGKSIGPFAGRIALGKCKINNIEYELDINEKTNCLHGGKNGISNYYFNYQIKENKDDIRVIFTLDNYLCALPGLTNYKITYVISKLKNKFKIIYNAKSSEDTLINLTNHGYFNLSGNVKDSILNHTLKIDADYYTKLDDQMITTSIEPVNKVMDFRKEKLVAKDINDESLQNHVAFGIDHCFIKGNDKPIKLKLSYKNRSLSIKSSYPSVVCYSYNYVNNVPFLNKENTVKYDGLAIECQYIPNGINMDNVNKAILKKGKLYNEYIEYSFN